MPFRPVERGGLEEHANNCACQRGATKRQGEQTPVPMCPDSLTNEERQVNLAGCESRVQ
jgi:hypothetical protein